MKRHVAYAAAAALFASAGYAYADTAEGLITEIDWERQTITLETGEEFVVPEHELTDLETGDRVIVTFDQGEAPVHAQSVVPGTGAADLDPAVGATAPATGAATAADPAIGATDPATGVATTTDPAVGTATTADPAMAESGTVDGIIALVDWEQGIIELDTGERFVVPERELTDLETGDRVTVGYEQRDGQVVAHSVIATDTADRTSPGTAPGADPSSAVGETQGTQNGGATDGDATTGGGAQQ